MIKSEHTSSVRSLYEFSERKPGWRFTARPKLTSARAQDSDILGMNRRLLKTNAFSTKGNIMVQLTSFKIDSYDSSENSKCQRIYECKLFGSECWMYCIISRFLELYTANSGAEPRESSPVLRNIGYPAHKGASGRFECRAMPCINPIWRPNRPCCQWVFAQVPAQRHIARKLLPR